MKISILRILSRGKPSWDGGFRFNCDINLNYEKFDSSDKFFVEKQHA